MNTRQQATARAGAKYGFYIHLTAYILVNALLVGINLSQTPDNLWVKWPIGGWGIGIAFHALAVFVLPKGESIKEKMIEKEMQKE